ncbi:DUF4365 domain-containing protein [Streptomyces lavendulocolor]|uniref:DUF4365 domain-containing protein n=1 Tax=Streptomyces lavendulocolor TaxID=67316 RepID=A0ABV2W8G6_9ACTN
MLARRGLDKGGSGLVTRRPKQHQIASLAVASVRRAWNKHGHAVDEIKEDYGEDLLIQTCLDGRMDACKIWVQVKGTATDCLSTRKSLPKVRVKGQQILRWARSADIVVAVLWDVKNDCGWYVMPQGYFDHVELKERAQDELPLIFSRALPFDDAAVERLAWLARIEHANRSVQQALATLDEAQYMEDEANTNFHYGALASLVFDFSVMIGIGRPEGGFTSDFLEDLADTLLEHGEQEEDLEKAAREALLISIFQMIHFNCAGNGAPLALVSELATAIHPYVFSLQFFEMLAPLKRFPRD